MMLEYSEVVEWDLIGTPVSITIRSASKEDIQPLVKMAEKEHLLFANNTSYLTFTLGDQIIGFCGILIYSNRVTFKNDYVIPAYRGWGLWQLMFDTRKKIIQKMSSIKYIEASCTPASLPLYIRNGAKIVKAFKTANLTKIRIYL